MQPDRYSFADSESGLEGALEITLSRRRFGYKTRLVTRQLTRTTRVHTVIATPPEQPNREERGCNLRATIPAEAATNEVR